MSNENVKNIKKELLSDNWYTLHKYTFDFRLNNGDWVTQQRESYDRGNGAAILLFNKEKQTVVLTKQFRMPTYMNGNKDGYVIEVCAGLVDDNEPDEAIKRETEEETGYRIKNVKKVLEAYMSPGSVTEKLFFFVAEYDSDMKVSAGGGLESENEDIEVLEVPFNEAMKMMDSGVIEDGKTVMLLQYASLKKLLE